MQLQDADNEIVHEQFMRFVFVRGEERIRAWELGVDTRMIDIKRYCAMLDRAVSCLIDGFIKVEVGLGI